MTTHGVTQGSDHMSGSSISISGILLVAVCSLPIPAPAQTHSYEKVSSVSPATFPAWAYPWDPNFKVPPADDVVHRMPDSTASFSFKQADDPFFSPDWHPNDHPPMPDIVARGRKPHVRACGYCHRAEGTGGPENSSLAGLPAAYIIQQMADYKSGARKFSGPQRSPPLLMIEAAKAATSAEVHAAANYFAVLRLKPNINVIETDTVPKTYVGRTFFVIAEGGGKESIGQRIVEVPVNVDQFKLRDSRAKFVAYVPLGSLAKGEALVKTGGAGTTVPCAVCHGTDLRGVGPIPGIAGRSPSYVVRQLYDFKEGARAGIGAGLMKPTVEKLSEEDMLSIAAYVASLMP
jgi:cytochrome c553